jgi:hypothetical protein
MYKYSEIEYELEMIDEHIESEMHKLKDKVFAHLNSKFVHSPVSIKDLALAIAYGYWESNEHAENLAYDLDLGKLEFLAIAEDFEGFKKEYMKNYEEAQNF